MPGFNKFLLFLVFVLSRILRFFRETVKFIFCNVLIPMLIVMLIYQSGIISNIVERQRCLIQTCHLEALEKR